MIVLSRVKALDQWLKTPLRGVAEFPATVMFSSVILAEG